MPNAAATDGTWIENTSGTWATPGSWVSGTVADGAGSVAGITGALSGARTVTLDTSQSVGILDLGSTASGINRRYTISGSGALTFNNSASNAQLNFTTNNNGDSITAQILLESSLNISNSGTGTAQVTLGEAGASTVSAASSGTKTITNTSAGTANIWLRNVTDGAGVVVVRQNSATSSLVMGTTGGNSFSGGFILDAGSVNFGTNTTPLGSGLIQLNSGTVLNQNANVTFANAIQIGGNVTLLGTGSGNGNLFFTGATTLTGNREVTVGKNTVTLNGDITTSATLSESGGSYSFTKLGAGNFTLSSYGLATYTGGTFINEGIFSVVGVGNHLVDSGAVTVGGGTFNVGTNETVGAVSLVSGAITGASTLTGSSYAVESGSIDANLAGSGGLAKSTSGTVTLSGANTYSGATTVTAGTLIINGSGASAVTLSGSAVLQGSGTVGGSVTIGAGTTLAGTLHGGAVTGAGTVGPGNSPGIATFTSVDLDLGMDFKFELTAAGSPTWSAGSGNSFNDVLRLTAGSPILGAASSSNVFDIYFSSLTSGAYVGGTFTDTNSDFNTLLSGVTYNYWVINDANGGLNGYNGHFYDSVSSGLVTVSTLQVGSADFADGMVANGWSQEFTVVPEPSSTFLLVVLGLGTLVMFRRRSQRYHG